MSGIAQLLHAHGYQVQGSDASESVSVQRLRSQGISVTIGHQASLIQNAKVLVASSAIQQTNPEFCAALEAGIPVIKRADMLAELMRHSQSVSIAGSHGKTTTTSLIGTLFDQAQWDPTIVNGGLMNAYGSNMRQGKGEWMIVEADESDGTFLRLPTTIGIITNIDPEHMEFYGSDEALEKAFFTFLDQIPFYGCGILGIDSTRTHQLKERIQSTPLITYGFHGEANFHGRNVRFTKDGMLFDVRLPDGTHWFDITLSLYGEHNVQNALATIALGNHCGFSQETIRNTLSSFQGVKRRFTQTGIVRGITVIDDYAHHPQEIRSALQTARTLCTGRLVVICQPHRYSRLQSLFHDFSTCFEGADELVLLPVYAAGEQPRTPDINDLAQAITNVPGSISCLDHMNDVSSLLRNRLSSGDIVLCLGAGDITTLAYDLPQILSEIQG